MRIGIAVLSSQLLAILLCNCASAQLTITEPEPKKGPIRQVSSSLPLTQNAPWAGIKPAQYEISSGTQIRVSVQYLMLDGETRAAIYGNLDPDAIKTSVLIPATDESTDLTAIESPLRSEQQINSTSRVTTCVLNESDVAQMMQQAIESAASDVIRSPSVMLLDGKQVEMNDILQQPFMVDMHRDGILVKPIVHVIDAGTRLRLLARLSGPSTPPVASQPAQSSPEVDPPIHLSCELTISQVLDVKSEQVFGISEAPQVVQVPVHLSTSAFASQQLAKGQTLLVDPHVTKTKSVQLPTEVPMLGKIPYVGRSFKNTTSGTVEQHTVMLLRPSIENVNQP